ncbi:MAG: transglutaminase domain-containing protein [Chloroflexota bacterium]|jgi:hypothetical protein|nr:transglutaminase domain-containing protein [Chloroflexota bacterium]
MKIGYGVFGKAYEVMYAHDLHNPASIDHELMKNMILLDDQSAAILYSRVVRHNYGGHELYQFAQQFKASIEKETIQNVLRYTQEIAAAFDTDFDDMLFGGTEKQILDRGTDWCSDMARVGAVLLQCLGIPCRMLYLANPGKAYNGHVVNEAFYEGRYGVVDFIYGYQFYDRTPKSAFEIQRNPEILAAYPESYQGLFSAIAISEYDPCTPGNNYSISRPNDYYLKLIHTDHENMWLMGEDLVN